MSEYERAKAQAIEAHERCIVALRKRMAELAEVKCFMAAVDLHPVEAMHKAMIAQLQGE